MSGRWVRRLLVVLATLVLALLVARQAVRRYGAHRLQQAAAALETRIGSLELASLRLPAVPDEENAAYWILQAVAAAELGDVERENLLDGGWRPASRWSPDDRDRLCAVVARNHTARDLLAQAAAATRSSFGVSYEQGTYAEMPDFSAILRLARLEEAAAKCALLDGDDDRFVAAARAVERITTALCQEPVLIAATASSAAERMALRLVADYLTAGYPSRAVLAYLLENAAGKRCAGSLERAWEGETLVFHDLLPRVESLGAADSREPLSATLFREFWHAPFRDWGASGTIEAQLRALEALDGTWLELLRLEEAGTLRSRGPGFVTQIYDMVRPNVIEVVGKWKSVAASRQLAAAALEAAAERFASGAFPSSLELLQTPYAGEIPVYTTHADWAEVVARESEDLFEERQKPPNEQTRVLFRWRIPAPAQRSSE